MIGRSASLAIAQGGGEEVRGGGEEKFSRRPSVMIDRATGSSRVDQASQLSLRVFSQSCWPCSCPCPCLCPLEKTGIVCLDRYLMKVERDEKDHKM